MKLIIEEEIPLMIEVKELEVVEIVLELMMLVVEREPPILDVKVLVLDVRELETVIEATFKLVMLALVMLEVEEFRVLELIVVKLEVPVAVRLVVRISSD